MFASKTLDDCKPLQLRIQPPYTGVADQPQPGGVRDRRASVRGKRTFFSDRTVPDPTARIPVGDAARTPRWPIPYRVFLHGSGRYPSTRDGACGPTSSHCPSSSSKASRARSTGSMSHRCRTPPPACRFRPSPRCSATPTSPPPPSTPPRSAPRRTSSSRGCGPERASVVGFIPICENVTHNSPRGFDCGAQGLFGGPGFF